MGPLTRRATHLGRQASPIGRMGPIFGPLTLVLVLSGCAMDRPPARDNDRLGDGALGDGRVVTDDADTPMGDGGRSPGDGGLVPPGPDDGGGPGGADATPIGPEIDGGPPQPPLPAALCPPLQIETGTKRAGAAVSGDWNGDGFTDLAKVETVRRVDAVNAVPGQARLVLLYGRPDGTVDVVRSEIFEVTASLAKIQAFDLDLDGATDLMFGHGSLSFFRADGDGFALWVYLDDDPTGPTWAMAVRARCLLE